MLPVVLLSLISMAAAFDIPASHRLDPSIPTVSPHHNNASADSCIGQCAFTLVDEMGKQIGIEQSMKLLKLSYNDFLRAFSNVTFFEKFCGMYHRFQNCASKCESGYLHQMLMRSSEVIDHFCVYHFAEIKRLFPCIANMQPSQDCLHICTPHHQAVSTLASHFSSLAMNGDSTQAEKYLGESCEYVICSLHCDIPDIAHRCGHDTAQLVIDLTRKSFITMEKTALDSGVVHKWPKLCDDIRTYRLPEAVNPPVTNDIVLKDSPQVITAAPLTDAKKKNEVPESSAASLGISGALIIPLYRLL